MLTWVAEPKSMNGAVMASVRFHVLAASVSSTERRCPPKRGTAAAHRPHAMVSESHVERRGSGCEEAAGSTHAADLAAGNKPRRKG